MELRCVEQERQLRDNSNIINRLTNFKKSVLESFGEDDFRDVFNSKILTSQHSNNESSQLNIYGQKAQKCENEFFSDDYKKLQYLTEEKNRIIGYSPNSAEMLPSKPLQLEKKNNINTQISNNVNSEYHSKKQVEQLKMNLMENELHKINLDTIQNENSNLENKTTLHVDGRGFLKAAKNALTFDEFNVLLMNVNSYNYREQNKTNTLANLEELFGEYRSELFLEFKKLISGSEAF
ncbi:hypothetical protein HK099_006027 [Clydaea vesicula]|uniref:At4g15545-like C-terminal domain-containing protein n=1 Tax=Clydaea vesicula TaxID=447962 RepID=A0AAD5Y3Q6_9FUNG|nr:hypothetical protein HK099_006027 [Clydaea vesicula]